MKKFIKESASFIIVILIALIIKFYIVTPIRVNGRSMLPTLTNKDIMILNEIGFYTKGLKRFDIVVINYPGEKLIKRVIGLPGEKVEFKNNKLYINDKLIEEPFEHTSTDDFILDGKVPENHYFVVGDNRLESVDSRRLGTFPKSKIQGKTNFVLYPFNKIGIVK